MMSGYHDGGANPPPSVSDYRFVITAAGTVVYDSRGKYVGQYETEDAAVDMIRLMQEENVDGTKI